MSANDTQIGGNHYRSSAQHWDFAAHNFGRGYFKGQITKYLARWRKKGGVQDLQKAEHFLRKLIELEDIPPAITVDEFIAANEIPAEEAEIIKIVTLGGAALKTAEEKLLALIAAEADGKYVDQ